MTYPASASGNITESANGTIKIKYMPEPTSGEVKIPAAVQPTTETITPPKNEARYA
jgi:hypothetical protein